MMHRCCYTRRQFTIKWGYLYTVCVLCEFVCVFTCVRVIRKKRKRDQKERERERVCVSFTERKKERERGRERESVYMRVLVRLCGLVLSAHDWLSILSAGEVMAFNSLQCNLSSKAKLCGLPGLPFH